MRIRTLAVSFILAASPLILQSQKLSQANRCRVAVVEGEIKAGQSFVRGIGSGLEVMLEALPSGWILRVLPTNPTRPPHDYAELATPPYHSISPLLVSTDFSFRAQDAVGWSPRRFRYAPDASSFGRLLSAYDLYEKNPGASSASQQALAGLVTQAPAGVLTILDAHLIPGMADQPASAATLASHFLSIPHVIEPPVNGKPTPLGRITWLRFRLELELPRDLRPDARLQVRSAPCGSL